MRWLDGITNSMDMSLNKLKRHGRHNGYEFELTQGDDEGPGSLACCSPWGHKEPDTNEQLNNT